MRKLEPAEKIAITELRAMMPFFLICDGLVIAVCVIYIIVIKDFNFALFTGLILGNIAAVLNFYIMAYGVGKLTMGRTNGKKPRLFSGMSYGMRIISLFVIFYTLSVLGIIHPLPAVIPLLYPSFYYKFKAFFNKSV
jgi:hypothetical protein